MEDQESLIELYNNRLSYKEIARKLGKTIGSVKSAIYRLQKQGGLKDHKVKAPKIFIFDIETSTILVRIFNLKNGGYISPKNVDKDWFVICWAGRWLNSKKVLSDVVTPREARKRNDKRVCQSLWHIFNEADILVAHNGDRFDIKRMNSRWKFHKFNPPLPYRTYDTLKEHRKAFGSTSHSLDFIAKQMKIDAKLQTGFQLWVDCENGDQKALDMMDRYCKHDIKIGEAVYLDIRRWSSSGVNYGLYTELHVSVCPRCGGSVTEENKIVTTAANAYTSYRCNDCGHTGRTKKSTLKKEQRAKLIP